MGRALAGVTRQLPPPERILAMVVFNWPLLRWRPRLLLANPLASRAS